MCVITYSDGSYMSLPYTIVHENWFGLEELLVTKMELMF